MARDFKIDLAVANGYLPGGEKPIQVAVLVMLGPDGTIYWQSDKAYPMQTWVLANVADEVRYLEAAAIQGWPELAGRCDWWVPPAAHFDGTRFLDQEEGNVLGLQD